MARWQPGARERLQAATIELVAEQGFEQTTVAEIASRAGLTERTFFRYFADKREVLFTGQDEFAAMFLDGIAAAPSDAEPLAAANHAVDVVAADFFPPEHRSYARQRQAIIDAHPGLRERELLKLAGLATAMAHALQERGAPPSTALLAAELAVTVFRVAFTRWAGDPDDRDLVAVLADVRVELGALTGAVTPP